MRITVTALGLVCVAAMATAAPAAAQGLPDGVTQAMIAKGDSIFHGAGFCFGCHGADAQGVVGPSLVDDEWLHSTGRYDDLVRLITAGVPQAESTSGNVMPPSGGGDISDADVKAVSAYVWSLSHPGD